MKLTYRQEVAVGLLIAFIVGSIWGAIIPSSHSSDGGNIDIRINLDIPSGQVISFKNVTADWGTSYQFLSPLYVTESVDITMKIINCTGGLRINETVDNQVVGSSLIGPGNEDSTSHSSWVHFPSRQSVVDIDMQAVGNDVHIDYCEIAYEHHVNGYYPLSQAIGLTVSVAFGLLVISWIARLRKSE